MGFFAEKFMNSINFLKHSYLSDRILFDTRIFLNIEIQEFTFLVASILFTLDVKNKDKTFTRDDVLKIVYLLTSKNYMGKPTKSQDALQKLADKGYFVFIGNKKNERSVIPYYTIHKAKVNYFLSALNTFIEYELSILDSVPNEIHDDIKNLAKYDVLKHIEGLGSLFKIR